MNPNIITESVQQFNLKWTNYTTNLLEVMVDKFSKGFLTDVTLCCDGTLIRAHKMVLAACSTFFERLFEIYTESNPLIILNGVDIKALNALMQFMYRGEVKIHENEMQDILKLSNELQIKGLSNANINSAINKGCESVYKEMERSPLEEQQSTVILQQSISNDSNIQKTPKNMSTSQEEFDSENSQQNSPLPLSLPIRTSLSSKAFMVYANRMRKKLVNSYPNEMPKEISVRIGNLWKQLSHDKKGEYFEIAKKQEADLKMKVGDMEPNEGFKRKREFDDNKPPLLDSNNLRIRSPSTDDDVEFIEDSKDFNII